MNRKSKYIPIIYSLILFVFLTGHYYGYENEPAVIIPFDLEDNYIYIKIRIENSRPLDFAFDTGADGAIIDSTTAARLGLKPAAHVSVKGASGSVEAAVFRGKNVQIGHLKMNGIMFYGISLEKVGQGLGKNIDGIIGGVLLRKFPLKIDFDKKVIVIYSFDNFVYHGRGKAIDFRLAGYAMPLIPAALTFDRDEKIAGVFGLDTGLGGAIMLNTPFVRKNRITSKVGKRIKLDYIGVSGVKSNCYAGRIKRVRVGTFDFKNVPAVLNQENTGELSRNNNSGVIGNSILKRFNIIFNFRQWKLYLEPGLFFYKDFAVNCSGLRLSRDNSHTRVLVYDVIEKSPAEKAGMKKGDEIISLNGRAVKNMSLARIREILMEEGNVVKIIIRRRYVEKTFNLKLKKLI
jgi:hypothetical protein